MARTYKPYRWFLTPGDDRKVIDKPDSELAGQEMADLDATNEDNYIETGYDRWLYQPQRRSHRHHLLQGRHVRPRSGCALGRP